MQQFLEAADRIACRLCRDALWSDSRCNWLGWSLVPRKGAWIPAYRAQTFSLYDGSAGIAVFLARLYRFTGDPLHKDVALGALRQADKAVQAAGPEFSFGLHGGLAGLADAFIQAGDILSDGALTERGLAILVRLASLEPDPARLDVLIGSAGTVLGLTRNSARFGRDDFRDAAIVHARMLLRTAVQSEAGWSWETPAQPNQANLVGYTHGAAGIACALAGARSLTGEEEFARGVSEALRYERSHFNSAVSNWPDLRAGTGAPRTPESYPVAWCHGAVGGAFARLRLQDLPDTQIQPELDAAVDTTVQYLSVAPPAQASFCLCHGLAGNADLLLEAAAQLDRPALRQLAEQTAQAGLNSFHAHNLPWPCGVAGAGECPNLMLGLAGIGYFYLRMAAPDEVPSVLAVPRAESVEPHSFAKQLTADARGTN